MLGLLLLFLKTKYLHYTTIAPMFNPLIFTLRYIYRAEKYFEKFSIKYYFQRKRTVNFNVYWPSNFVKEKERSGCERQAQQLSQILYTITILSGRNEQKSDEKLK